jgi:hypothetical protein
MDAAISMYFGATRVRRPENTAKASSTAGKKKTTNSNDEKSKALPQ